MLNLQTIVALRKAAPVATGVVCFIGEMCIYTAAVCVGIRLSRSHALDREAAEWAKKQEEKKASAEVMPRMKVHDPAA